MTPWCGRPCCGPPSGASIQGGSKSKLLILSEYVNKTEKIGRNVNKYEQLQRK